MKQYTVYILTNYTKTALYIGVTNNIARRLFEHTSESKGHVKRYNIRYLVYEEHFTSINVAIAREKQLKKWSRVKKNNLIATQNPKWKSYNDNYLM